MHWIVSILILIGGIILSGCDSKLEAEEKVSVPFEFPGSPITEPKDSTYWNQVVFGNAPSVAEGAIISDPFEPIIIKKEEPSNEAVLPPVEAKMPPTIADRFQIAGIIQGRVPVAILRAEDDEHLVEEGSQIEDCTVRSIQRDRVILEGQGRSWTLKLQGTEW